MSSIPAPCDATQPLGDQLLKCVLTADHQAPHKDPAWGFWDLLGDVLTLDTACQGSP